MDRGYGRSPKPNSIPPRTTWKSSSPRGSDRTMVGIQKPSLAFQFLKTTAAKMNKEIHAEAGSKRRLNGAVAGCHDGFLSPRPVLRLRGRRCRCPHKANSCIAGPLQPLVGRLTRCYAFRRDH